MFYLVNIMRDQTLRLFLTCLFILSLTIRLSGWTGSDHKLMLREALTRLPLEMRIIFFDNSENSSPFRLQFEAGAVKPDRVFHDTINHVWHVKIGKNGRRYGKAPRKIASEVYLLSRLAASPGRISDFAEELGIASHYLADINNPLHTGTHPLEKKMHSRFERNFQKHGIKAWQFDGYDYYPDITSWVKNSARWSWRYYDSFIQAYQKNGFPEVIESSRVCYEHGINDIIDLFYNVYVRCGSLLYQFPQITNSDYQIALNSASEKELSQIYYISPRLALRIVRYRQRHQGFSDLDELLKIKGVSKKKLRKIKLLLSLKQ